MQSNRAYILSGISIFFAISFGLLGSDLLNLICYPIRLLLGIGSLMVAFGFGIWLFYTGLKQQKLQTDKNKTAENNVINNKSNASYLKPLVGTGILLICILVSVHLYKKTELKTFKMRQD